MSKSCHIGVLKTVKLFFIIVILPMEAISTDFSEKNMKKRDTFFVGLMLFSMFFGAGNLIFPPFLGMGAGTSFWPAIVGFIVTAVGLPLLVITAIALVKDGANTLGNRVHPWFNCLFNQSRSSCRRGAGSQKVYAGAMLLTGLVSLADGLKMFGLKMGVVESLLGHLPFASVGLGWVVPAVVGALAGVVLEKWRGKSGSVDVELEKAS